MGKKLNTWVIPSVVCFICSFFGFVSWMLLDEGIPDFALFLTIITFLIWGVATSKGLSIGVFRSED